jgi:hypothetical protein
LSIVHCPLSIEKMKLLQKIAYPTLAFALSLLVMSIFFGDVMLHPNDYITESDGDGIKNHFAYNYYIKHDKGLEFTGMNYPYGEHLFFPDAQPILAIPFQWMNENITPIEDFTIGINIAMLFLSVGFCGLFLFLILRKFHLPTWYALPVAVLIACLSPQLNRIYTHQSLSYTVYLPMLWYMILIYEDAAKHKWLRLIFIAVWIFFFAGLHLYYLALGFFFVLAYVGIAFLSNLKSLQLVWKRLISLLIASLLPVIFYQVFLNMTDADIATRIQNPWGFFYYTSRFESIFIPAYTPFETLIRHYFKMPEIRWEGYGAVGVVGSLVFIFTLIRVIRFAKQKRFMRILQLTLNPRLNQFIWASVLLLLFSMAVPFVWGMEGLLDYIPPIKQFRSVGRFNWAFYYVFTVYTASYIYTVYKRIRQKQLQGMAQFFMAAMLVLWFANDYAYLKQIRYANEYAFKENSFKKQHLPYLDSLNAVGFNADNYQAMIGLPLIYKGSEKLGIFNSRISYRESFPMAYHLGLPMMNAASPRMPIDKSMKIGQLWSDTLIERKILTELPSDKPFLAVVFRHDDYPLQDYEQRIVRKGKLIAKADYMEFYELPISAFKHQTSKVVQQFSSKDGLFAFPHNGQNYYADVENISYFKHRTFDDLKAEATRNGNGALQQGKGTTVELFNDTLPSTDTIMLTYWMKNDYLYHRPNMHYKLYDTAGNEIYQTSLDAAKALNYQNGWVMVEFKIPPQPSGFKHYIYIPDIQKIMIDDVMLRPNHANIFWKNGNNRFIFNNIEVNLPSTSD